MWVEISALGTAEGLAVYFRCLSEPHKLGIWDGNLLRITILTKFPILLVFWQNFKFRGNGSCRKTSVWCWPAPGRRSAQERETKPMWLHVFTPLKRSGFGSNQERALGVFIFCQLLQIPFTWLMKLWTSGGNKGLNKFSIFLVFKHALNEPSYWEKKQSTEHQWGKMYSYHKVFAGVEGQSNLFISRFIMWQQSRWYHGA